MSASLVFLLAFGIGLVTGLRSMTGPALVCCAAHLAQPGRFAPGIHGINRGHICFFCGGAGRTHRRQIALHPQPDFTGSLVRPHCPGRAFGGGAVYRCQPLGGYWRDPGRSGWTGGSVCRVSGARRPGEEVRLAGLGHRPAGRPDRGWRRPIPGFAILSECAPTPRARRFFWAGTAARSS